MSTPSALNPHLRLFHEAKAQLLELGFSLAHWAAYPYRVPEFPRPALMYSGDLGGYDLMTETASFPHPLPAEPQAVYFGIIEGLLRERRKPMGRPAARYWVPSLPAYDTSVQAVLTPARQGFYEVPSPALALPYHVAEFAWLIHRHSGGESELVAQDDSFYTVFDDTLFGVVDGAALDATGNPLESDVVFEVDRLMRPRAAPNQAVPKRLTLWRAIGAFIDKEGLAHSHPDLMQALSHCRHALPATLEWEDSAYLTTGSPEGTKRPRKRSSDSIRPCDRALAVEGALSALRHFPDMTYSAARRYVVPIALSADEWREYSATLTAYAPKRRRAEWVAYLERLHKELLEEA